MGFRYIITSDKRNNQKIANMCASNRIAICNAEAKILLRFSLFSLAIMSAHHRFVLDIQNFDIISSIEHELLRIEVM